MDILQKQINCSICNKPLSLPPINYKDSIGNICGRCISNHSNETLNDQFVRQRVYEDIAKYLRFPCSYRVFGCKAELKWDSVEHHEDICDFINISCPLSHEYFQKQCSWIDEHENLAEHIRTNHKKFFCSPPTMKITKKYENRILFWEITGRMIIIIMAFKDTLNKYFCYILGDFVPEQCCLFQCRVSISSDNTTSPLMIQHEGIQPFSTKNWNKLEHSFQIDAERFEHLFSTAEELLLKFDIVKIVKTVQSGLNEKLLCQLECPVCFEYMKPPIFICQTGHNFCQWCCNKIQKCPICRGDLLGGRNFTLEAVSSAVEYPCVYTHYGCSFVALSETVKGHERYCSFIGRKCFLDSCEWKGLHGDLLKHLEDEHPSKLHPLNTTYSYKLDSKNSEILLIYNNDIFLLKICFEVNRPFDFAVLHYEREATSYNYELQIMGCSPCISITLSNCCQPVPFPADILTYNKEDVTSLPSDFIQQFILNYSRIELKLNITSNKV